MAIPFCVLPEPLLDQLYFLFQGFGTFLEQNMFPNFSMTLKQARMTGINPRKYITYCFISNFIVSISLFFMLYFVFFKKVNLDKINPLAASIFLAVLLFMFFFIQQLGYPRIIIKKRVGDIEMNLLPALQNILVQLKSGIPLFDVIVNIAAGDYGEVSKEFMTVVKQINGGLHQIDAFERMAIENPSHIFRSAVWQMVNGMKTGSELADVMKDIIIFLADEEILQIEQYGAVLSPLTMFYMIGAVILPALGINFLIVLTVFMPNVGKDVIRLIFWGVYGLIFFFQFMFLNIIKAKRPSLLER